MTIHAGPVNATVSGRIGLVPAMRPDGRGA